MPATDTITAFYVFSADTVIKSAYVNNNFDLHRGHIIPIDPNTSTAAATQTYDLGSDGYRWRRVYGKVWPGMVSTTGSMTIDILHDVVLMDPTAGTLTASFFAVAGNTGASFHLKNIGSANTVFYDGSGAETIDDTITGNLIPGESALFYCTGVKWHLI